MTSRVRRAGVGRLVARVVALTFVAALASVARPAAVSAHALLRSSEPTAGATLGEGPDAVTLTFSERPDLQLTSVKVLDTGGTDHATGDLEALTEPPDSVRVAVGELADGVYTVSWRTVSQVDGHISAGSFAFGVGVAPPSTPAGPGTGGASQSGSPPAIVARWILYLGFMVLIGAAFVAFAVAKGPAPDLLAMAAAGWLLIAIGTIGVVGVQWAETGAPIETLVGTSVGAAALARAVSLVVVGAAVAALAVSRRLAGRAGWAVAGLAALAALVVDVATGHAAAGPGWLPQIAIQSAHGAGAAAWVGGLAGLLVALRTTPEGERLASARRFSAWAGWALALVAATGVVRAVAEVETVDALLTTDFGRVVLLKSALLLGLAALGAFNRFVSLRTAATFLGRLRRVGAAELTIATAVVGLSALLVNLTPPASAGAPVDAVAPPIVATGHDFGTSVRVRLVASPGPAGSNTFDLAATDYDTGAPVDASAVELRFELVSQEGVESSTLDLEPAATPGRFSATGANLSIDGIWQITATITQPGGAVEVPLLAATSLVPQPVESLVTEGLPTLYNIALGEPGFVQTYLDPDKAGTTDLHVTFFTPAGGEIEVEGSTIAIASAGGEMQLVTTRRLGPGHFVATIDAASGPLSVDAVANLAAGATPGHLHTHVTIEVNP